MSRLSFLPHLSRFKILALALGLVGLAVGLSWLDWPGATLRADELATETISADALLVEPEQSFAAGDAAVFEFDLSSLVEVAAVVETEVATTTATTTEEIATTTETITPSQPPPYLNGEEESATSTEETATTTEPAAEPTPEPTPEPEPVPPPPTPSSSEEGETPSIDGVGGGEPTILESVIEPISRFFQLHFALAQTAPSVRHIVVRDPQGGQLDIDPEINLTGGKLTIKLPPPSSLQAHFRPGEYTLDFELVTDTKVYTLNHHFAWGVLVINHDKNYYQTGDSAYLQIATLSSKGETICDANLELTVTSPNPLLDQGGGEGGGELTFSGSDIQKSESCGRNNVTDEPDYSLRLPLKEAGTYKLKLTNKDNGYSVEDEIIAVSDQLSAPSLVIERLGATRINPFASTYTMTLKVTAQEAYEGELVEQVPEGFEIIEGETSWNLDLAAGESQELSYTYQAPKISPQVFILGPLTADSQQLKATQWQLASDATSFNDAATGNWNIGTTWGGACASSCTEGVDYPGPTDDATIDSHTVTLTAESNVNNLTISTGGTLVAGAQTLHVAGNWDSSGGTFTYGTGTVDLTGTGTVRTAGTSYTKYFYNLNAAAAGKITTLISHIGTANVLTLGTGTLNQSGGSYSTYLLLNGGTPLVNAGATIVLDRIVFSIGTAGVTETIPAGNYGTLTYLQISPSASNVTVNFAGDVTVSGSVWLFANTGTTGSIFNTQNYALNSTGILVGGSSVSGSTTFNAGQSTLAVGTGGLVMQSNGGTHTLNLGGATITNTGPWTLVNGTGSITQNAATSTVTFTATSGTKNITSNGQSFNNLVFNGSGGTFNLVDNASTTNFTLTNGTVTANDKTITVSGNWDSSGGTFTYGTGTVDLTGTGTVRTAGVSGAAYFYNLNAATSTKTTTLSSSIGVANVLTLGTGTLSGDYYVHLLGSGTPFVNNGATIGINWLTYYPISGPVNIAGGNYGTTNFIRILPRNSSITFNFAGDITTSGTFSIIGGTGMTGTIVNTQNYALTATAISVGSATSNGSTTLNAGQSTISIGSSGLVMQSNGGTHTLNLGGSTITNTGPWTLSNGTGSITQNAATSTVTFTATSGTKNITSNGQSFNNLVFNGTGGTFNLVDNASTTNFTLTAGTVTANDKTITVSGNWDSSGGTFTYGTGTVDLTGTGTLKTPGATNSSYFYNLNAASSTKTTSLTSHVGVANVLTLGTGTFNQSGGSYSIYLKKNGGTPLINAGATITLDTIYFSPASGTVTIAGGNYGTLTYLEFYALGPNVVFNFGGNITLNGTLYMLGLDASSSGTVNTQNYSLTATAGVLVGYSTHTGSITFNAGQSVISTGRLELGNNGGSHIFNLGGSTISNTGNWELVDGTGSITQNAATSTVTFSATSGTKNITSNGQSFNNLVFNGSGGTFNLVDNASTTNFTLTAGTVTANATTITVSGNWDSSGGTFTAGTGTVDLTGTGNVTTKSTVAADRFYNLNMATSTRTTTILSNVGVSNIATLGTGTLNQSGGSRYLLMYQNGGTPLVNNGATISIFDISYRPDSGTVTVAGGNYGTLTYLELYPTNSNVTFNFAGDITVSGTFWTVVVAGKTGTVINTQNHSLTATGMSIGNSSANGSVTFNAGQSAVALGSSGLVMATGGGSHTLNLGGSTITNTGPWTLVNGTGSITQNAATSTVTFTATSGTKNITSNGQSFNNLVFNGTGGTFNLVDNASTTNFTLTAGTVTANDKTITVSGNWDSSGGTFTYGTGTVDLTGSGNVTTNSDSMADFYNLNLAAAGKTTTLLSHIAAGNVVNLGTGIFTDGAGSYSLYLRGSGTPLVNAGATISVDTVRYYGPGNGATVIVAGGDYGANTTLQLWPGSSTNVTYNFGGNVTANSRFWMVGGGSGMVVNTQNYSLTTSHLYVGNGGANPITFNAGQSTIDLGSLGINTFTNGGAHIFNLGGAQVTNAGPWELTDGTGALTVNAATSTVTFDGTGAQAITGNASFYNLTINNSAASPGDAADVDPTASTTVSNLLTISDGQFQPATGSNFKDVTIGANGILKPDASASLNVAGNWSNASTGGSGFVANGGTVNLTGGNQAISGTNSFYNLAKSDAVNDGVSPVLTFPAGLTTTVDNLLTLAGIDADDRLNLVSSTPGEWWYLNWD